MSNSNCHGNATTIPVIRISIDTSFPWFTNNICQRKLTQTRLCKYNLFNNFKYSLWLLFFQQNLMIPRLYLRLFHVTIWICRWRANTLVTSQYQSRLSSKTKILSRRISQSDWNIQIKFNYIFILQLCDFEY